VKTSQEYGIKLPQVEFTYNSTVLSSMGMSPFTIVYRKIPRHLLDLAKLPIGEKFNSVASVMTEQVLDVQESVRLKLEKSNAKYKETVDKKRREKVFEEVDMVMVYLRKENSCWILQRVETKKVWVIQDHEKDQ